MSYGWNWCLIYCSLISKLHKNQRFCEHNSFEYRHTIIIKKQRYYVHNTINCLASVRKIGALSFSLRLEEVLLFPSPPQMSILWLDFHFQTLSLGDPAVTAKYHWVIKVSKSQYHYTWQWLSQTSTWVKSCLKISPMAYTLYKITVRWSTQIVSLSGVNRCVLACTQESTVASGCSMIRALTWLP